MKDIHREQRISQEIWNQVDDFRRQGAIAIAGMPDTEANWLHEFETHQLWLEYADRIWPGTEGVLSEEESKILSAMRKSNPSDED